MFKTILRTLSAFSIVTITASAGFAQNTGDPVDCEALQNQNLPECKVNFFDWTDSFASPLNAEPDTLTPHNEFLRGYSTWLGSQGTAVGANWMYSGFNETDFGLNGNAVGGMAAYQATHTNGAEHYYAGILSGTNLGAPVTETIGVAVWYGRFQAITGGTKLLPRDIVLKIDFGAAKSIDAFLAGYGVDPFKINGTFDNNGVISGRVAHRAGLWNDPNQGGENGTLTGLIGQDGAVGAFIADGSSSKQYAGGFSASPTAERTVNSADWVGGYGTELSTDPINPTLNNPGNQFLQGYHWGLSSRGLTLQNWMYTTFDATDYGFNVDGISGIAAFSGVLNNEVYYYAGILGDTDLGAPLPATGTNSSAIWNGTFQIIDGGTKVAPIDFALTVHFRYRGKVIIEGFIPAVGTTDPYKIIGYSDTDGVIGGHIHHVSALRENPKAQGNSGDLIGLIGQKGVVGAFISHATGANGYTGGFVARPGPPVVEYADWVNNFSYTPLPAVPDVVNPQSQFLRGTADGINNGNVEVAINEITIDGVNFNLPNSADLNLSTATFDGVGLGGDAADGVAWFHGANGKDYGGIFSGTDLGAPLTETEGTVKFYGKIGTSYFKRDFALDITFNAESTDGSVGTVRAFVYNYTDHYHLLDGTFDDNGVISGTLKFGVSPNNGQTLSDITYTSVLTGLIGEEGAVGVFVDKVSSGGFSHGGFVAVPKVIPLDPNVKFSDWGRSFGNTSSLFGYISSNDPERARFLPGTDTGFISYDFLWNPVHRTLTLADGDLGGEIADGVAYMSGHPSHGGTTMRHYYAGILHGTNLGAVLDAPVTAAWRGELGMIASHVNVAPRDITLDIDFARKGIEIAYTEEHDTHRVNFNNLRWDADGVITGGIIYNSGADSTMHSPGIVTGLIGKQGAVGSFISFHGVNHDGTNTPYAGGFVARPAQ